MMKRALSIGLSAALVFLAPGSQAWAAAGRAASGTPTTGAPVPIPAVVVPTSLGALSLPSTTLPGTGAATGIETGPLTTSSVGLAPGSMPGAATILDAARLANEGKTPDKPAPQTPREEELDGNGNPRREQTPGPDSRDDGSERRPDADPDFSDATPSEGARAQGEADFNARLGLGEVLPVRPELVDPVFADGEKGKETPDKKGPAQPREEELDPNGNPPREQSPGPDDRDDGSGSRRDDGPDFRSGSLLSARSPDPAKMARLAGVAAAGLMGLSFSLDSLVGPLLGFAAFVISVIPHEMGHAWAASKLGDPTARLEGRMSWKPRDLLTHIDPMWTLAMPLLGLFSGGMMIGGARPVPVRTKFFRRPNRDMALTALAGPAANVGLALLGTLAFAGLAAAGVGGFALTIAATFVSVNVMLAVFNLLPFYPLDGHHILRALLPKDLAAKIDGFYRSAGYLAWAPLVVFMMVAGGSGIVGGLVYWITGMLLGAASMTAQLATASLPAVAALGLMLGQLGAAGPPELNPNAPISSAETVPAGTPAELIVVLDGRPDAVTQDLHLSFVDIAARGGVAHYARTQAAMLAQLEAAGVNPELLAAHVATPIATYGRINAATIRVDAEKAAAFRKILEGQGHKVFDNGRRKIIPPVPFEPEQADPAGRGSVKMDEVLTITRADRAMREAADLWGAPGEGWFKRLLRRALGASAPQPPVAVIDTGVDKAHPLLRQVAKVVNGTDGPNKDDIGHGSWVTSAVLNYARWLKNLTHYKAFVDGSASTDDVLKALTSSANDGNIVISNSWGSDDGDPNGPDSLLVKKLAQEGHVLVFAAGNSGSRPNTVGSPAIVYYQDPATKAPRVLAVAAAGRDKRIASFSSRGPGSPKTKGQGHEPRPDLSAIGANVEGAWPTDLGGADRTDPRRGPTKDLNGTSMSTPDIAGAIALLCMLFGVTARGEKLDAVVNAIMSTLEKTGQSRDAEGAGFLNLEAAYEALLKALKPAAPNRFARWLLKAASIQRSDP